MDWIRKKYWKKSLRYPWPWKSTVKATFHILLKRKLEMALQRHWCAKNGKKVKKLKASLTMKYRFLRSRVLVGIFLLFFTYSTHQTTYENLLKTWLILEIKFDLETVIFKVKGVCGNFFTIFFIFSAWNYIEVPFQTFMTNETNFLHWTLRCLRGWSISNVDSAWSRTGYSISPRDVIVYNDNTLKK